MMITDKAKRAAALAELIRMEFIGVPWDEMNYVLEDADWRLILEGLGTLHPTLPAPPPAEGPAGV